MSVIRNGQVAIQHWNSNPASVEVGGKIYSWVPKYNVSLAWVDEADVPYVLSIKVQACCGVNRGKFVESNENNVSIWETGHLP